MSEIINRVANSPLVTINLEDYYDSAEKVVYDIKDNLFQELILKEMDFRKFVKENDWSVYEGKHVAITCSVDAIVPTWAYMLLTTKLSTHAKSVIFGSLEELEMILFKEAIANIEAEELQDKPVVIKGCGDLPIPTSAYVELTKKLQPFAKSIMYGEPCSTVPIYKKKK